MKVRAAKDDELKERGALDVALVPEKQEDIELAKKIRYHGQGWLESWMHANSYSSPVCPTSKFSVQFLFVIKWKSVENHEIHQLRDIVLIYH